MPILNNLTVNEIGGSGPLPAWYRKQYVDSDTGELKYDRTQTTFSTNTATEINVPNMFENLFNVGLFSDADGGWLTTIDCSDLVSFGANSVFSATFAGQDTITSIDFSSLEYVFETCFSDCFGNTTYNSNYPTTISFPSLTTAEYGAFMSCWSFNENITQANFPVLESAGENCFVGAFQNTPLEYASFGEATATPLTIGNYAFSEAFVNLTSSQVEINFGNGDEIILGTDCFQDMFRDCDNHTILVHAPAYNQAEIEAMSGYPKFGAGNDSTVTWDWSQA